MTTRGDGARAGHRAGARRSATLAVLGLLLLGAALAGPAPAAPAPPMTTVALDGTPQVAALAGDHLWVLLFKDRSPALVEIDPSTARPTGRSVALPPDVREGGVGSPSSIRASLAVADGDLFVPAPDGLLQIDPERAEIVRRVPFPSRYVAAGDAGLWAIGDVPGPGYLPGLASWSVARIDPATGAIAKTLLAGIFGEASGPVELAVGDTDLWLAVPGRARSLIRLHLWNETSEGWPVPSSLLTEHDGALYTVGPDGGTLTVIRGNGSQPLGVLALTDGASWRDLAVGPDGTAWGVTSRGEGRTGSLVRQPLSEAGSRIPIPADPVGVTVGSTAAWVIGASGRTLTRVPTAALARHDPVHLTAAQLRINQRISQAAVQRLNVLTARVDGRPAPEPVAGRKRGRVRLTAEQLLINQRISQAAVRRANALAGRLEGVLHGTTAARPQGDAVTISARQLLIGQRIAQAAVRRANDLAARIPIFPFSWPEPEGPYLDKVNGTLETAGLGVITLTEAGWNGPMGDNAPFTAGDRMPVVFQDPQPAFAAGARIGAIGIVFGGVMFARYVSIEPAPDARG